jgi:hypothetical protein
MSNAQLKSPYADTASAAAAAINALSPTTRLIGPMCGQEFDLATPISCLRHYNYSKPNK